MSPPLPRYRQDTDPRKVDRIVGVEDTHPTQDLGHRSGEGDERRLRAIPVIARGVPGTIPLTEGYAALADKQRRAERFKHLRLHRS